MKKPDALAPTNDADIPPELEEFVQSFADLLVADFFRREREASATQKCEHIDENKDQRHKRSRTR